MRYRHTAIITFRGRFPLDMLRYDCCYPSTETDSTIMDDSFIGSRATREERVQERQVTVTCVSASVRPTWTTGRWNSFGTKVHVDSTTRL